MTAPILAPYNSIFVSQGSTRTLAMTVTDPTGKVVDLTSSTVIFTVKETVLDTRVVFRKSSASGSQIAIISPRGGQVQIYLVSADTRNLQPKDYVYDIWVIDSNDNPFPVLDPTPFVITPSVTILSS